MVQFWNPVTGAFQKDAPKKIEVVHTRKTARGRTREKIEAERLAARATGKLAAKAEQA